jgi:hypothetical protein
VLGPEDITTILTLYNLGDELGQIGEFTEAEAALREAFQLREKTLGAQNPATLYCRAALAETLAAENKGREAKAEAREVVKVSGRSADGKAGAGITSALSLICKAGTLKQKHNFGKL